MCLRAVLGWLRTRAGRQGVRDGRSGAVAIIQRFGAALNLNVRVPALVVDGVFVRERGRLRFRRMRAVAAGEVARLLETMTRRIRALLIRRGVWDAGAGVKAPDRWAEDLARAWTGSTSMRAWRCPHGRLRLRVGFRRGGARGGQEE